MILPTRHLTDQHVLDAIDTHELVTARRVAHVLDVSVRRARVRLQRLAASGQLIAIPERRKMLYSQKPNDQCPCAPCLIRRAASAASQHREDKINDHATGSH